MLRHIVMFRFKERENVSEIAAGIREHLLTLPKKINELKYMEVGLNVNFKPTAFDLVLVSDFENEEGLDKYRVHPDHIQVVNILKKVVDKTAVVDYFV